MNFARKNDQKEQTTRLISPATKMSDEAGITSVIGVWALHLLTRSGRVIRWREVALSPEGVEVRTRGMSEQVRVTQVPWAATTGLDLVTQHLGTEPATYDVYQVVMAVGRRRFVLGGKHDASETRRLLLGVEEMRRHWTERADR